MNPSAIQNPYSSDASWADHVFDDNLGGTSSQPEDPASCFDLSDPLSIMSSVKQTEYDQSQASKATAMLDAVATTNFPPPPILPCLQKPLSPIAAAETPIIPPSSPAPLADRRKRKKHSDDKDNAILTNCRLAIDCFKQQPVDFERISVKQIANDQSQASKATAMLDAVATTNFPPPPILPWLQKPLNRIVAAETPSIPTSSPAPLANRRKRKKHSDDKDNAILTNCRLAIDCFKQQPVDFVRIKEIVGGIEEPPRISKVLIRILIVVSNAMLELQKPLNQQAIDESKCVIDFLNYKINYKINNKANEAYKTNIGNFLDSLKAFNKAKVNKIYRNADAETLKGEVVKKALEILEQEYLELESFYKEEKKKKDLNRQEQKNKGSKKVLKSAGHKMLGDVRTKRLVGRLRNELRNQNFALCLKEVQRILKEVEGCLRHPYEFRFSTTYAHLKFLNVACLVKSSEQALADHSEEAAIKHLDEASKILEIVPEILKNTSTAGKGKERVENRQKDYKALKDIVESRQKEPNVTHEPANFDGYFNYMGRVKHIIEK